jgi:histidine triad (HIT) family protein
MSSIFTKIVNGEIPCYKIAEDDHYLAFDVNQMQKGIRFVPKFEVDKILIWTKHII